MTTTTIATPEPETLQAWCRTLLHADPGSDQWAHADQHLQVYVIDLLHMDLPQADAEFSKLATLGKAELLALIQRMIGLGIDLVTVFWGRPSDG